MNIKITNDNDLIQNVLKENDSISFKELELRHSGICHKMIKKYYHNMKQSGIDPEDVISEKAYVIYKSIMNFNPDKNVKFSTWLGNQMRYHCLNTINKNNQLITMEDEAIKNIIEKNQLKIDNQNLSFKEKNDMIFSILDRLKDERIKKIFKLRYFNNKKLMSWADIGRKMNLSTQTIINLHNKGKLLLKNKLTSVNNSDII
jgi:RNA polymerase sigma factor (sigma-70 family)